MTIWSSQIRLLVDPHPSVCVLRTQKQPDKSLYCSCMDKEPYNKNQTVSDVSLG